MSLRLRIALAAALAVAGVAIVLGGLGYLPTRAELIDQVHQQLQQRAETLLRGHGRATDHHSHGSGAQAHAGTGTCASNSLQIAAPDLGGAPGYFQSVCPNGRVVAGDGGAPQLPVTSGVRALAQRTQGSFYRHSVT